MSPAGTRSLAFDVGRLDDGPPFLDFGLLKGAERGRCLLVARGISRPWSTMRERTAGSARASTTAALSLAITLLGAPLGTHSPHHREMWNPGRPASSTVGISGAAASRVLAVTA